MKKQYARSFTQTRVWPETRALLAQMKRKRPYLSLTSIANIAIKSGLQAGMFDDGKPQPK